MAYFVEGVSHHLPADSQVRRIGEFTMIADAIAAAQQVVEEFLISEVKPGMDGQSLFSLYRTQGEHPFIFRDDDKTFNVPGFNHASYAMARAKVICDHKQ
jgi:hypothetical protein